MTAVVSEPFQKPRKSVLPEWGKLLKVWNTDSLITRVLIMSVPSDTSDCSRPTVRVLRWKAELLATERILLVIAAFLAINAASSGMPASSACKCSINLMSICGMAGRRAISNRLRMSWSG